MGVYDRVHVEHPLPDDGPPGAYQTKSLPDPSMSDFRLDAEGRFHRRLVRFEDTGDPSGGGFRRLRRVEEGEAPEPYTGLVVLSGPGGTYCAALLFGELFGIRTGNETAWKSDLPDIGDALALLRRKTGLSL